MDKILHQLVYSISHYLQIIIHQRWCRILSINSRYHTMVSHMIWYAIEKYLRSVPTPPLPHITLGVTWLQFTIAVLKWY